MRIISLALACALSACGSDIETAEQCEEEGGNLQIPPGSCPSNFVSAGNVEFQGDIATCCLPGERGDVLR
ncbi:MAG: hypothetical protein AAGD10_21565 [Myxococcota bacterium]